MDTADKVRAGADAGQSEMEDAFWGVLVHAMTHAPAGDRLDLRDLKAAGTFEAAVLPVVRMAWKRTVEALALEAMVEHGTPPPFTAEPPEPEDG